MILEFFFVFLLVHSGKIKGADSDAIALKPERVQLLKDALGWMTFRKNGVLMEEHDVESLFLDTLLQKYITSKFYRTFVITFHQGVLPGLTLKEGDSCNPDYTFKFKDPFNSSVTWHYQKKFNYESYDYRIHGRGDQYCDYRQGLKCIPSTKKCECPEGSRMQPISSTSQLQRCLLEKDEICALIDIDHGNDPSHSALASNLYHLIFNLEKPLSCKDGTQCRFKDSNRNYPLCYENSNGPWFPDKPGASFELGLVDECAIGLYASPGSCKVKQTTTNDVVEGYVCFNFGLPKSIRGQNPKAENRTGFCFPEWGIYGLGVRDKLPFGWDHFFRPYIIAFVHPRTVPLRGSDLRDFYRRYTENVAPSFSNGWYHTESDNEGYNCHVGKSQKMEQAWKYFSSLEADPPPGKDYVIAATKTELFANLDILEREVADYDDRERKVCKLYWTIYHDRVDDDDDYNYEYDEDDPPELPPLTCVTNSSVTADGNDGTCQLAGSGAETKKLAEKIHRFRGTTNLIYEQLGYEERFYDSAILKGNPELECLPSLTPVPHLQFQQRGLQANPDTLEGGYCPTGFVCYQDFSDSSGMYEYEYDINVECKMKPDAKVLLVCHDTTNSLESCESRHLSNKLNKVLGNLNKYEKLGSGQACFYNLELTIRKDINAVHYFNEYEALAWIERGICDRKSKRLECTADGTCESMDGDKGSKTPPESHGWPTNNMGGATQPCVKPVAFALIIIAITSGILQLCKM